MFLRESRQKRVDGSVIASFQLAESVWNKRKKSSTTNIVYNFGRADDPDVIDKLRRLARSILRRCSPDEIVAADPSWRVKDAWPYGCVYVLEETWKTLGIGELITKKAKGTKLSFDVERAIFAMVANRAISPCSKLYCWEQWLREDVRIEGTRELELHQLYRAMDFLEANKEEIEKELYFRISDLLNLDVDLVFYDTTSLHFEVDEEDRGNGEHDTVSGSKQAGGKKYKAPRKRGYPKNGRWDVPQIVVGLAVTRDGLPVRHWVFPGNTVDVTTVKQVKADLKGWKLGRCVFVGDAGMVSADNLKTLSLGGGKYIVCMPIVQGGEVAKEVLTRRGRYKKVAHNLRVKEVLVGEGERRRRYVVCHNPEEEVRQRKHRAQVLEELEAELVSLQDCEDNSAHSKRACRLRVSGRYGKYLRMLKNGQLKLDRTAIERASKYDGKFVVHSNDDTLNSEDLALGYKQLMRVEEAWRTLKSVLRMRPVFHWAPHRIHSHIFLTVLSLLVERVMENACEDTWRNIRDDLNQIKVAQLSGPNGTIWQVTEPRTSARNRLKSMRIKNPPLLLDHV